MITKSAHMIKKSSTLLSTAAATAILFLAAPLLAQTTSTRVRPMAFEVASIKPAPPLNMSQAMRGQQRIGMKIDAARVDIANLSLADLIRIAYRIKPYQIVGPDWIKEQRFDIVGKLPEGASPDQVREMLQELLSQRFKLAAHREAKEHDVYALVVAKNGPKLVDASAGSVPPAQSPTTAVPNRGSGPMELSEDASSLIISVEPSGPIRLSPGTDGMMRLEALKATMPALADMLSRILGRRVVDMTALKGTYQLTLNLSMQDMHTMVQAAGVMPPGGAGTGGDTSHTGADTPGGVRGSDTLGSSVFENIQKLGLKLETRKAPVEMIVIDHLEKAPTEN